MDPLPRVPLVRNRVRLPLQLSDGSTAEAEAVSFHGLADPREHLALRLGPLRTPGDAPLVRVHSECLTGDVFGSRRCDCGPQLDEALRRVNVEGGWVLYLRQEGRGIGLYAKLDAYALQDGGLDTYEANRALGHRDDDREYLVAAQMLAALDLPRVRLLTNNPHKAGELLAHGVDVVAVVPTGVHLSLENHAYLAAKVAHQAHTLDLPARVER